MPENDNRHGERFYALSNPDGVGLVGELGPLSYRDLSREAPNGQKGAWGAIEALQLQGEQIQRVELRILHSVGAPLPKSRGDMTEEDWILWRAQLEAEAVALEAEAAAMEE